jgi:DNA-binding response OmpR family regulator
MDGYISKPIGADTLFAEIEAVKARHASAPSRSAVPSEVVAQRSNTASD